jgi:hypothetical protein
MGINLACVPIILLLYPETKQQPLESIERLFNEYQPLIADGQTGASRENHVFKRARSSAPMHSQS